MQTLTSRDVQTRYGEFVETVQDDMVCVTRHGRPLYWALADRQVRGGEAGDPSLLVGRMLLLHGQLNPDRTGTAGDGFAAVLNRLDASIQPGNLTELDVMDIVHAHRT